jgi:hypothetical protein
MVNGVKTNFRGLFPDSRDGNSVCDFEFTYLWLIHFPQILLGNVCMRIMNMKSATANMKSRYTISSGSALLEVYNKLGPVMEMTSEAAKMMPYLKKLMEVNPYTKHNKKDNYYATFSFVDWYDKMQTRAGVDKLWSNIPTFISLLCWMAIRSEGGSRGVPVEESLFYVHRLPSKRYYKLGRGTLSGKLVHTTGEPGNVKFALTSWKKLVPKFIWRKQCFDVKDSKEVFAEDVDSSVAQDPLDLLQMADLFFNDKSIHWERVLGPKPTDEAIAAKRKVIDGICAKYQFEMHFFNVYKDTKKWCNFTEIDSVLGKQDGKKEDLGNSKTLDLYLLGPKTAPTTAAALASTIRES